MKRIGMFVSVAFLLLVSVGWVRAQQRAYDFISIDPPSSVETFASGINAQGQIVGSFRYKLGERKYGYLLSKGSFRVIDVFGAYTVRNANGINASGDIVGNCVDESDTPHGFLLRGRNFIAFDYPGGADTYPRSINDAGDIVGNYSEYPDGPIHGFLLSGGKYTTIDFPDAYETLADSINDAGDIVGDYGIVTSDGYDEHHGFLLRDGTFIKIDNPNGLSGPGQYVTVPYGINPQGNVVGVYDGSYATHGFLMQKAVFTDIDFPGANVTRAFKINARGWIVGDYSDENWVRHGFLATE